MIERIVVCVFDGLRPDMVTPELTPNLMRLAASGCRFREARSVFPSMTRVATTSIATGAPPSVHGVVGNAFYFPEVARGHVLDVSDIGDIRLAEEAAGGRFITAETFADRLAAAGKRLDVVHSGSAGSAYCLNPRARANGHWTFSIFGEDFTQTPEAVTEVTSRFGPLPKRTLPRFDEVDYAGRVFVEHVLGGRDADVALIWFNEPDTSYHYKFLGSAETIEVLMAVDTAFGRILDWIDARPDADRYAVIAASDHGQISSREEVKLADLLTAAGHPARRAAERTLDGASVTFTGGNMGEIRILDGGERRLSEVGAWLRDQPFIGGLFSRSLNEIEGVVEGSFALSQVALDHERQPDLVYVLRSSNESDPHGLPGLGLITGGVPVGGGMHGGLNRYEMTTTLIVRAPGLPEGSEDDRPVGIIDIAPTILDLLGLSPPSTMRGRSLVAEPEALVRRTLETGAGAFQQTLSFAAMGGRRILLSGGAM